jgi:hypothetical protein
MFMNFNSGIYDLDLKGKHYLKSSEHFTVQIFWTAAYTKVVQH